MRADAVGFDFFFFFVLGNGLFALRFIGCLFWMTSKEDEFTCFWIVGVEISSGTCIWPEPTSRKSFLDIGISNISPYIPAPLNQDLWDVKRRCLIRFLQICKGSHQNFDPFLLPKNLWLLFMGKVQNGPLKKNYDFQILPNWAGLVLGSVG